MKLFARVLAITLLALNSYGQDNPSNNSLKIIIQEPNLNVKNGTVLTKEVVIPVKEQNDTIASIDIKADHWNNNVYNPYQNALVKFPLKIEFKDSLYTSPIDKKKVVTSRYGWRRGRPHMGIDIDLVTGDNVYAIADGIVRFSSYSSGHGKTVVVRHYNGLETVYAHLSERIVKANDSIKKGQILGKGGNTGNSRGSHLHLVAMYKGVAINPEYLFDFSSANKIRNKELWVTRKWTSPHLHSSRRQSKLDLLLSEEEALASLAKQPKIYVVKKGDTLYGISRRNQTSVTVLCKTNYIKPNAVLKVGQKLILQP